MAKLRWLLPSMIACAHLGGCADRHDDKPKAPAMTAGASAISEEGRDPFGSEAAASAAIGDDPDDAGTPCPNFSLTIVGPYVQLVGDTAVFSGHAQDDQQHEFALSWSASGGELSEAKGERTKYTCSELGVQTISMTATLMEVCSSAIAHVVTCLEPTE